jgi:hypothetical protein
MQGDTKLITEALNIPTFKGSKYAADLPTVLDSLIKSSFQTFTPACKLMQDILKSKNFRGTPKARTKQTDPTTNPGNMLIKIGGW